MGGSSYTPTESVYDVQLKQEQIAYYKAQTEAANRPIEIPEIKAAPPLAPTPTESSMDVQNAYDEEKRRANKRTNTGRNTLFAGETGGYKGPAKTQTLLG